MPELINLPFDGRDIVIKESIADLDRTNETNGIINGKFVLWDIGQRRYPFRLVGEDSGNLVFETNPEIVRDSHLSDSKTKEVSYLNGTLDLDTNHFSPGIQYSIGVKLLAKVIPGIIWTVSHKVDTWIVPPRETWEWEGGGEQTLSEIFIYCQSQRYVKSVFGSKASGYSEYDAYLEASTDQIAFADVYSGEKIVVFFRLKGKKIVFDKVILSIKEYRR